MSVCVPASPAIPSHPHIMRLPHLELSFVIPGHDGDKFLVAGTGPLKMAGLE